MRALSVILACALVSFASSSHSQEEGAPSGGERSAAYDPHKDPKPNPPWLKDLVKFVAFDYPEFAEYSRLEGAGIFRASIDAKSGVIVAVKPLKSTGYKVLDDAAAVTIRQWRMKPHTWEKIDVPVTYRFYRRH